MTEAQFKKRFPGLKKGQPAPSEPRPIWRNPAHFQHTHPEWTLVHGFSNTLFGALPFAWLEKDGIALDVSNVPENTYFKFALRRMRPADLAKLVSDYGSKKSVFYKKNGIGGTRSFTKEGCRKQLDSKRTYGPWKEIA